MGCEICNNLINEHLVYNSDPNRQVEKEKFGKQIKVGRKFVGDFEDSYNAIKNYDNNKKFIRDIYAEIIGLKSTLANIYTNDWKIRIFYTRMMYFFFGNSINYGIASYRNKGGDTEYNEIKELSKIVNDTVLNNDMFIIYTALTSGSKKAGVIIWDKKKEAVLEKLEQYLEKTDELSKYKLEILGNIEVYRQFLDFLFPRELYEFLEKLSEFEKQVGIFSSIHNIGLIRSVLSREFVIDASESKKLYGDLSMALNEYWNNTNDLEQKNLYQILVDESRKYGRIIITGF